MGRVVRLRHSCGCEIPVEIDRASDEPFEVAKDRLAQSECDNCYSTAANDEAGMPSLVGSSKQVGWANSIRRLAREKFDDNVRRLASFEGRSQSRLSGVIAEAVNYYGDLVFKEVEAAEFIAEREWLLSPTLTQLVQHYLVFQSRVLLAEVKKLEDSRC